MRTYNYLVKIDTKKNTETLVAGFIGDIQIQDKKLSSLMKRHGVAIPSNLREYYDGQRNVYFKENSSDHNELFKRAFTNIHYPFSMCNIKFKWMISPP